MQSEEVKNDEASVHAIEEQAGLGPVVTDPRIASATQIVTADFVQAEEVPTLPIASLQAMSTLQPEVAVYSVASTHTVSVPTPLVAQPVGYRRSWREWAQIWGNGLRLHYLPLSIMPILLGSVLAWLSTITPKKPFGSFHIMYLLGISAAALLLQLGAHLINDYYDFLHGIDVSNMLGPGGLVNQGYVKPRRVLAIALSFLVLGAISGLTVILHINAFLFLFFTISVLCAFFYSATPYALSSKALGEIVVLAIFGPFITLMAYMVQVGHQIPTSVVLYGFALGLLALAVLHANNMRDIEGDVLAGKHTLATIIGIFASRILYLFLVLAAYGSILFLGIPHQGPHLILIVLWTLPMLAVAMSCVMRTNAPTGFHLVMRLTIKLEVYFTILLIIALIITSLWPMLPFMHINIVKF